jgi:hypothetical protein
MRGAASSALATVLPAERETVGGGGGEGRRRALLSTAATTTITITTTMTNGRPTPTCTSWAIDSVCGRWRSGTT